MHINNIRGFTVQPTCNLVTYPLAKTKSAKTSAKIRLTNSHCDLNETGQLWPSCLHQVEKEWPCTDRNYGPVCIQAINTGKITCSNFVSFLCFIFFSCGFRGKIIRLTKQKYFAIIAHRGVVCFYCSLTLHPTDGLKCRLPSDRLLPASGLRGNETGMCINQNNQISDH